MFFSNARGDLKYRAPDSCASALEAIEMGYMPDLSRSCAKQVSTKFGPST